MTEYLLWLIAAMVSPHVLIGESEGEFEAEAETPEAALAALIDHVRKG